MSQTGSESDSHLRTLISEFVERRADYYVPKFLEIEASPKRVWSFNLAAALIGPLWAAARGVWGLFWLFATIELFALVQLFRSAFGDLGAAKMAEARAIEQKSIELAEQAERAAANGAANADTLRANAENLEQAAAAAIAQAEQAVATAPYLIAFGICAFLLARIAFGLFANTSYEAQFSRWKIDRMVPSGVNAAGALFGLVVLVAVYPLTLYRFTIANPDPRIIDVPIGREYYSAISIAMDRWFDRTADAGRAIFDAISLFVTTIVETLEVVFLAAPWPAVMLFVFVVAWKAANIRVAIFSTLGLVYLGMFGFWDVSMITFALTGTAAALCIAMGIPLGVWFSNSPRAYAMARPVLDFMQTLPPFVYLIPVIAFFGTGRVPAVLATIVVAMPPVIRLTTLGLNQVDRHVVEAARAFGATRNQVLLGVKLPLAAPSIMAGVNQTILNSLGMVVIAALIGAKGLGQNVVDSLVRISKGDGILAGLAILICAMILDRIVQGRIGMKEASK